MRKVILLITVLGMASCGSNTQKKESNTQAQEPIIGADKDEHGCLVGAGQTWSNLNQTCMQVFNEGKRLNPTTKTSKDEAIFSAFVVFNQDKSKCELFLPNQKETVILEKSANEIYTNEKYSYDDKNSVLLMDTKITYKGE
jgi:hypothetical protein